MKKLFVIIIPCMAILLFIATSCKKKPTEPDGAARGKVELMAEETSCTEAWIAMKKSGIAEGCLIKIFRDSLPVAEVALSGSDTVLYFAGHVPGKTYTYRADAGSGNDGSTVTLRTLDTTNFSVDWNYYYIPNAYGFGYCCTVVDDTTIYYGGDINLRDSTGNAMYWTYGFGKFEKNTINFYPVWANGGAGTLGTIGLNTIINIQGKTIVTNTYDIVEYDGKEFRQTAFIESALPWNGKSIRGVWAKDSDNVYYSGKGGVVHYYNGQSVKSIDLNSPYSYNGIYGAPKKNGEYEILAAGYQEGGSGSAVYSIGEGGTPVQKLDSTGLPAYLKPLKLWFVPGRRYIVVGEGGAYTRRNLREGKWEKVQFGFPKEDLFWNIKGRGLNDIWILRRNGIVYHFNGVRWRELNSSFPASGYVFVDMDIKGNKIVLFGNKTDVFANTLIGTIK